MTLIYALAGCYFRGNSMVHRLPVSCWNVCSIPQSLHILYFKSSYGQAGIHPSNKAFEDSRRSISTKLWLKPTNLDPAFHGNEDRFMYSTPSMPTISDITQGLRKASTSIEEAIRNSARIQMKPWYTPPTAFPGAHICPEAEWKLASTRLEG